MQSPLAKVDVLGVSFDNISLAGAVAVMRDALQTRAALWIVTGNVHYVMRARREPALADVLRAADLIVADGVPILWAARAFGTPLAGRVNGTDLVWQCAALSAESGRPIALIGSAPEIAQRAAEKLEAAHPGARVVAIPTPNPLSPDAETAIVAQIEALDAGIVLVGLGVGKQDTFCHAYCAASGRRVWMGVGGAFELISGHIARAPRWMQRAGLEWLWRLSREPRRLWRRYLVEDAGFVGLVVRAWLHMRRCC